MVIPLADAEQGGSTEEPDGGVGVTRVQPFARVVAHVGVGRVVVTGDDQQLVVLDLREARLFVEQLLGERLVLVRVARERQTHHRRHLGLRCRVVVATARSGDDCRDQQ